MRGKAAVWQFEGGSESRLMVPNIAIADRALFVVGAPRSGTTWVQSMLLSHPRVCGGQESNFFSCFGAALRRYDDQLCQERQIGLPCYWRREELTEELRRLWVKTVAPVIRPGADLLVEKTPSHAEFVLEIAEIVPQSRFIHVIRDSRAVSSSLLAAAHASWGGWAPAAAKQAARLWVQFTKAACEAGRKLGSERYTEVHYEDLMRDTKAEIFKLFDFLGIDATEEVIDRIVASTRFDAQRQRGGISFELAGERERRGETSKEPDGFFRNGTVDSWKRELNLLQKLAIWYRTRNVMLECGYAWRGRVG